MGEISFSLLTELPAAHSMHNLTSRCKPSILNLLYCAGPSEQEPLSVTYKGNPHFTREGSFYFNIAGKTHSREPSEWPNLIELAVKRGRISEIITFS